MLKRIFSRDLDQNKPKNALFLKKSCKNLLSQTALQLPATEVSSSDVRWTLRRVLELFPKKRLTLV